MNNTSWDFKKSSKIYGVNFWGKEYFKVNDQGHVQIHPTAQSDTSLDLFKMLNTFKKSGIELPLLLRFPDIIDSQMKILCDCFKQASKELDYKGKYYGVFPIKVNQQKHVIKDIVQSGKKYNFGLEAGSKPELLIALSSMSHQKALIICNGFKDASYIELALLSLKSGRNIFLVIERQQEISIILDISKKLNIRPQIGFRLKLNTQAKGFWESSSGDRSKFGLNSMQLVSSLKQLKQKGYLDCVELVHFHIGSQIPSIQPIKLAIKECANLMSELYLMNCPIKYVDVGGGLSVDYDGSGFTKSSANYNVQEYANDIVFALQSICEKKHIPHPHIISESGRFLVAQSSLLIFNVLDSNFPFAKQSVQVNKNSSNILKDLNDIYKNLAHTSFNESFNDLIEKKKEITQTFIYGNLSLEQASKAETVYWQSINALKDLIQNNKDYEELFVILKQQLTDTYFCNFSVFQSLPDSWALSYIFPIMPIHRLNEKPDRQAHLVDLTCDSDGRISKMLDYSSWKVKSFLPVHALKQKEPYFMAIFLTGAYQEILGDLHNLFGDTNALHIRVKGHEKYTIEHHIKADSIYEVLQYVEFHKNDILDSFCKIINTKINKQKLSKQQASLLISKFKDNLFQSTYLK